LVESGAGGSDVVYEENELVFELGAVEFGVEMEGAVKVSQTLLAVGDLGLVSGGLSFN
jgi:hypothetical protein